ncbi:hypothetical protein AFB00_26030 [Pseudonocardia sp. HH130630-07]|nr:hypothetical protein AFB00_26030 [Pseudonocardia sp. HH130630-07]
MPRIGVTGHSKLTPGSEGLVLHALRTLLAAQPGPVVGVTCLARGADQLFAQAVLDTGGTIEVVLPSENYRSEKVEQENRQVFDALAGRAAAVRTLPFPDAGRDAYAAAGDAVLSGVDLLVAVWDGAEPDGRGGTGDTVAVARERGVPVEAVWPDGAGRR